MKPSAKNPRTIVVKTLLNPDEFLQFDEVCTASDVSHSAALREMVKGLVNKFRNGTGGPARKEWPSAGQKMAMAHKGLFGMPRVPLRL